MHSYTSRNEYFVIDIGKKIPDPSGKPNTEIAALETLRARLATPMFPLNISSEYFIPILHQDQLLKAIEKCGEFNQLNQMPGARKQSSAHDNLKSGQNSWLEKCEFETSYPKLMLEQRMNRNIKFKVALGPIIDDDFSCDLQLDNAVVHANEKERQLQQSLYYK